LQWLAKRYGTMRSMKNIVILISGVGSNMEAIVRTAAKEKWPVNIAAVISNRDNVPGLKTAAAYKIPGFVISHQDFSTREAFDRALQEKIDSFTPDLVVLAGFLRILTPGFVRHYAGRMLNIHPSLLPSFTGLATHKRALDAGVKVHGATVHFVTPELDYGPIISQAAVPVLENDSEETLAARVLQQEHIIYPHAVRCFIEDRLKIEDGRVHIIQKDHS
jgi:phosphoribosylglycinamide formyltransferase 1